MCSKILGNVDKIVELWLVSYLFMVTINVIAHMLLKLLKFLWKWTLIERWSAPVSQVPKHRGKLWSWTRGKFLVGEFLIKYASSQISYSKTLKNNIIWNTIMMFTVVSDETLEGHESFRSPPSITSRLRLSVCQRFHVLEYEDEGLSNFRVFPFDVPLTARGHTHLYYVWQRIHPSAAFLSRYANCLCEVHWSLCIWHARTYVDVGWCWLEAGKPRL